MKRILIADDDANIRKALSVRLKSAGYQVELAHDGLSATSVAIATKPDLILLDLSMPAGDGHAVLKRLNEHPDTLGIPVFVVTASQKEGLCEQVLRGGARAFFEKPVDSYELLGAIENELLLFD